MDVRKFSHDTLLTIVSRVSGFVAGLLVNILIARTVGPRGKGIATMVYMYPFFAHQILSLGLENANTYYISSERRRLSSLVANTLVHTLLMTTFFFTFSLSFKSLIINSFFKIRIPVIFFIAVVMFPLLSILKITEAIFVGLKDFKKYNLLIVIERFGRLPFAFFFLIILNQQLIGCAIFQIFPIICALTVSIILLSREIRDKIILHLSLYKKTIVYGIKSQAGVMITQFNYRLDHFLIASLRSISDLGIYSMGVVATEIIWYLPESLSKVFFPRVASLSSKEEIRENAALLLSTTFWFLIIIAGLIILLGKPLIVALLGSKFLASYTVILLLLPGTVMLSIGKIASSVFHGIGKPEYGTYLAILGFIATIILDILLIPKLGIRGAAIASSVAYSIMGAAGLIFLIRLIGGGIGDYLVINIQKIRGLLKMIPKR